MGLVLLLEADAHMPPYAGPFTHPGSPIDPGGRDPSYLFAPRVLES